MLSFGPGFLRLFQPLVNGVYPDLGLPSGVLQIICPVRLMEHGWVGERKGGRNGGGGGGGEEREGGGGGGKGEVRGGGGEGRGR